MTARKEPTDLSKQFILADTFRFTRAVVFQGRSVPLEKPETVLVWQLPCPRAGFQVGVRHPPIPGRRAAGGMPRDCPDQMSDGDLVVECEQFLGGLLNSYYRTAAYRRALALSPCCALALEIARGRRSCGQFWRDHLGPERCIGRHGSTRVDRFEVRPHARKPGLRGRDLASLVLQLSRAALSQRGEAPRRVHGRPIGPTSQARNCCLGSWLQRVRLHGAGRIVLEAGTVNPGPLLALLQ